MAFMDYGVRGVRKLLNRFGIKTLHTKLHKTSQEVIPFSLPLPSLKFKPQPL